MNVLMAFFPILKMILELIVKNSNISESNKARLFAAMDAVENERSVPLHLRDSIQKQKESFKDGKRQ